MTELRLMWSNTRMVVLCAISAALYAAVLVPFKVVPLIPGVTELRPANAIPVVCSFLFGPAGAWGSAIGNMIGDFFGGVSPGDVFGFFANLAYGYIPYKVWNVIAAGRSPVMAFPLSIVRNPRLHIVFHPENLPSFAAFFVACLAASVLCADLVGWGDNMLALRPFAMLGNVIIFNNMASALILSPFILAAVYPRVRRGRMLYTDVMPELKTAPFARRATGLVLLIVGESGGWVAGNLLSTGYWVPRFLPAWMTAAPYDKSVGLVLTPFMLLAVVGLALI